MRIRFFRVGYSTWPPDYPRELGMHLAAFIGDGRVPVCVSEATT